MPGFEFRYPAQTSYPYGYGQSALPSVTPPAVFDPVTLLLGLKRRWFLAVILGMILGGATAAITWNVWPPDVWTGQATVHISPTKTHVLNRSEAPKSQAEINGFLKYHASLLRSYTVISTALSQPEIQGLPGIQKMNLEKKRPLDWVQSSLGSDFGADEIIRVYLTGEDRETITGVLNAIVDAYFHEFVEKDEGATGRIRFLQSIYDKYYKQVMMKKDQLQYLAKESGIQDAEMVAVQLQHDLNQLAETDKELFKLQSGRWRLELQLKTEKNRFRQLENQPPDDSAVEEIVQRDHEMERLTKEVEAKENYLIELEKAVRGGADSPLYKEEKAVLGDLRKQLAQRKRRVTPLAEDEIRQKTVMRTQLKINELEEQIANTKEYEQLLIDINDGLLKKTRQMNAETIDMENLRGEIAELNDVIKRLGPQIQDLKIELDAPGGQISRVDSAWANPPGIGRKQIMATCTAGIGGFAFALLWVSWREFRARKINTLDEIVHGLGLRLVGTLPAIPGRGGHSAPSSVGHGTFWPNFLIESVDTTRTMLLHAARVESIRSVMITSAQSGEGKTSLAIQLAASLARAGRKTLLIDGDMRNSAIHQVFNVPAGPGFSELLRGESPITAAIQPTSIRGLWIIPGGKWNAQSTEGLAQEAARTILHRLKDEFDFVVVDSSPALMVVDPLLLGQQVDAAIFAIMYGVSHSPSVYSAQQRLQNLGIRILGAVVNGVAGAKPDYQLAYDSKYSDDVASSEPSHDEWVD
jgi:capsular exopolysaccharide synthesis family protein